MHRLLPRAVAALLLGAGLALAACTGGDAPPRDGAPAPPADAAAAGPGEIDLSRLGHLRGSPEAPVTVVEFSDFGCPYCARFALETLPELTREYVESGQVRWLYIPFELGIFPNGGEAALAAECAAEQGRFWEMHDHLYLRQREWKTSDAPAELFGRYARSLGLNAAGFASCYRENRPGPKIETNNQLAAQLGVRGTPSFLVNGRPVQEFRMLLEMAAAEAAAR